MTEELNFEHREPPRSERRFFTEWTETEVKILKTMLEQGASAREISMQVGRSRNAVLGYVHRKLRQPFVRKSAARKPRTPKKKEEAPPPIRRLKRTARLRDDSLQVPVIPIKLSSDGTDRLLDIKRSQCKWVTGEGINPIVCGEPVHRESSWCEHHHGIVFMKRKAKTNDNESSERRMERTGRTGQEGNHPRRMGGGIHFGFRKRF